MFSSRKSGEILALFVLVFGFSLSATAQADCAYGFRIYARDEAGKVVPNGKLEVSGASKKDKLPTNARAYIDNDGTYTIVGMMGATIKGDFLFKIAVEGFETFERRFNFPVCQIQPFELRLRPKGSIAGAVFERLFTVHGKVYDEEMKPFGNAKIEAAFTDGRVYRASSNAFGYYELVLPVGVVNIRVTDERIPDVVFDNFKVEKNYSVLNVPVCLKCKQTGSGK